MEVREPRGDGVRHGRHLRRRHDVLVDVVEEGAVLVVLGHKPELDAVLGVCKLTEEKIRVLKNYWKFNFKTLCY